MSFTKYVNGLDKDFGNEAKVEPKIKEKPLQEFQEVDDVEVVDNSYSSTTSDEPVAKDNSYYWNMVDEDGERYNIPLLTRLDPGYYWKYIDFMKMKEQNPEAFAKILRWD